MILFQFTWLRLELGGCGGNQEIRAGPKPARTIHRAAPAKNISPQSPSAPASRALSRVSPPNLPALAG
jgi:hypothetical protein